MNPLFLVLHHFLNCCLRVELTLEEIRQLKSSIEVVIGGYYIQKLYDASFSDIDIHN
jgi:hypothetical protein